ncbi:hypothetical protein L873DRAFT_1827628 [Choiromyces venosus 120613-1]|uniref:Fatty acid synthase beta subunit AflB /Fas1-like central domain-containing protein n=1 Tax=Choiromyces venosus 120613-1 TaxID=1336337 RepID=A0A3N4JTD9_9PEZI|nr:hypothetical protein L873DRAFT_1827628 [Choiromyces venosus 120613-1]
MYGRYLVTLHNTSLSQQFMSLCVFHAQNKNRNYAFEACFVERKVHFANCFLPISAPFHSLYLESVTGIILEDLKEIGAFTQQDLAIPVLHTSSGQGLRDAGSLGEAATVFRGAIHILDFGPRGISRLGVLTHRNKDGTGIRIIIMGTFEGINIEDSEHAVKYTVNWQKEHGTKLTFVDTKFSGLLRQPPVMAAWMMPCTVPWDLALQKIQQNTILGACITVNLIYVNLQGMGWQIPLLQQLHSAGIPIEGLTIGGGYIETIGLKHISFKLGSIDAMQQVISIAKANPTFLVILQWTGGRGGSHHSFEDFHKPILQIYGCIWRCGNIALKLKSPPMPFKNGVLFGSKMMTAKEAHTSSNAKKAMCEAEGIDDKDWEKTYKSPAAGVTMVWSEMDEPIHKLATDAKHLIELKKKHDYIIKRLNADFQKTWEAMYLKDMTYARVIYCMVELTYVEHESRWIDPSLKRLTGDLIQRIKERITLADLDDPFATTKKILAHYTETNAQLINAPDMQHFLLPYQRCGQKPVPFVPSLDKNFEFWFNKDSLWQSQDLEAVVDQDVGGTCIPQGPMGAKYSTVVHEPIKDILDGIHYGHIAALTTDVSGGDESVIPVVEYFGGKPITSLDDIHRVNGFTISETGGKTTFRLSASASQGALPDADL